MNKLFTKIATAIAGFAMVVGVGVAVANSQYATKLNAESVSCAMTGNSNVTLKVASDSTGDDVKSGKKMNKGAAGTITVPAAAGSIRLHYHAVAWKDEDQTISLSCTNATISKSSQAITSHSNISGSGNTFVIGSFTSYAYSVDLTQTSAKDMVLTLTAASNKRFIIFDAYYDNSGVTPQPTTYSITYNKNTTDTVTGMPDNQTGLEAGTYNLSDAIPARTGYTFGGWGATSESTTPITSVTISNEDKTVYAIWSETTVSGTFNKHTGALVNGDYILTSGNVAMGNTVSSSKIQSSSLSFTNGDASITNPVESSVYRIESVDIEGVTYWTLKNEAANKYVQGATSTNMTLSTGSSNDSNRYKVTISNNAYNFLCKATESENTKRYIRYYNSVWGSYASSNGNPLVLYKKSVSYTISYNNNGGSGTMDNSVNTVSACTFTAPSGKEFDHWNTAADNSGKTYKAGDTVLEACTLYAIWKDLTPTATINKNLVNLTIGGSSETVTASTTNITNPTFVWARYSGDECVTLENANTNEVTISVANSVTRFSNCVVRLTINGTLGGNAITPITKDVTVKISRTSSTENPFNVAEARTAIDELTTIDGAYVSGIISQIDSYSSQYKSITYWISDDGTTSNQMKAFGGKGLNGADFSSVNDIEVGAQVKITGDLLKYGSDYELNTNNQLVTYTAPVRVLSSIALSGDYPDEFLTGDDFSHEGMVVTANYDNGSQSVVTNDATFTGYDMSTEGVQEVTVSYEENGVTKTVTYDILVTYVKRTAFNLYQANAVTEGDYILFYNGVAVDNTISDNRADYAEVTSKNNIISNYLDSVVWHIARDGEYYALYNKVVGKYLASTGSKNQAKLEETITDNSRWTIEVTGDTNKTYDFVNKARSEAQSNPGNKYLRYNNGSGFACYASGTGGELSLYKKNSRSEVEDSLTQTKLSYHYEGNSTDGFVYSNISIRFGGLISKDVWNELNSVESISGFGVMITAYTPQLRSSSYVISEHLDNAVLAENNPDIDTKIVDYYMPVSTQLPPENDNNYVWNLFQRVDYADRDKTFTAVAYIKVGDQYIFMEQERYSVCSLAYDYLTERGYADDTADGSLIALYYSSQMS